MELATNSGSKIKVSDEVFGRDFSEPLVHQVVTAYLAGARAGTKAQKTRAEVAGGGRKPWRQKGTGNARAGTRSSPIWRTGGRAFAAKPRSFKQKVNRKMYQGAMRAILSELLRQERLVVVDDIKLSAPKTKDMYSMLSDLNVSRGILVSDDLDNNVYLASRNIPGLHAMDVAAIDPVSLVQADKVVMSVAAINKIEEWLA